MTLPNAGFDYQDLIDGDAIRILILHPAADSKTPLQCDLATSPRTACAAYEALSYCWGPEEQAFECVVINRGVCIIRQELATALRHLRRTDRVRRLWADAICINQRCKQEKSKQVDMMDITYQKAAKVLVWLGQQSEHSRLAMKAVEQIGSRFEGQTLEEIHSQELVLPEVEGHGPSFYLPAIRELMRREWFGRLWVCFTWWWKKFAHQDT